MKSKTFFFKWRDGVGGRVFAVKHWFNGTGRQSGHNLETWKEEIRAGGIVMGWLFMGEITEEEYSELAP